MKTTCASWAGVLAVLFTIQGSALAQGKPAPNDPIVLLLKGIYQPATKCAEPGPTGGEPE